MGGEGGNPRENEVAGAIVDAAIKVHRALGPGMLESAYQTALTHELRRGRNLVCRSQVAIDVWYEDLLIPDGFRADLIVEELVLVELKSVQSILPVHRRQTLTYLRFSNLRLGLLLNFGAPLMRDGIARIANRL